MKKNDPPREVPLAAEEFDAFFSAVHDGDAPFPWQRRLAAHVFQNGWPATLDVPTSAGKTAVIDIAVFHLALEADLGAQRTASLRTLFVVDRRLVVDDAFARAQKIARALVDARHDVVERAARRLMRFAEDAGPPLAIAMLRGGVPKENDWVRTPAQPAVVVSTVDQVGSRLLFRGYGVSNGMWPVHAGLLGNDARVFLDEAHLSQPFAQTARALRPKLGTRFGVVSLSATPQDGDEAFNLLEDDDRAHKVLGPRLKCSKLAALVAVDKPSTSADFAAEFAAEAIRLSRLDGAEGATADVVAVVVNRVLRARSVYESLADKLRERTLDPRDSLILLTGRSRPIDREERLRPFMVRIKADSKRQRPAPPLFVVATQCVEAGADLDFDALVTEIAPLDSLRQRFGRLRRLGRPLEPAARATILAAADQIGKRAKPDPVYGTAPAKTWELLEMNATLPEARKARARVKDAPKVIDFGVEASRAWMPERAKLQSYAAPRTNAPVLMPVFAERWAQTSPEPASEAEIPLFLHGPNSGPADVQVVWRADLQDGEPNTWADNVAAVPPSSLEAIALPIWEVQRWLSSKGDDGRPGLGSVGPEITDADSSPIPDEAPSIQADRRPVALRWTRTPRENGRQGIPAAPDDLRPGDTIVVPATYGGCDEWGWQPQERKAVIDRAGDPRIVRLRRKVTLRLSPTLAYAEAIQEHPFDGRQALERAHSAAERRKSKLESLREESAASIRRAFQGDIDACHREVLRVLEVLDPARFPHVDDAAAPRRIDVLRERSGRLIAFQWRLPQPKMGDIPDVEPAGSDSFTETDESSRGERRRVRLRCHSRGVERFAETFARQAGLDDDRQCDLKTAALLHDAGKAQRSFKCWLYGGDELAAQGEALAKSDRVRLSAEARARAGLPKGARHEVASLAFAEAHPRFREAKDPDLVLWLIGTHHGVGRPFFPAVEWPPPGEAFEADVDGTPRLSDAAPTLAARQASWLDLHARLHRRYGAWKLAYFEAVLRLADHRRSEAEQRDAALDGQAGLKSPMAADVLDDDPAEREVEA